MRACHLHSLRSFAESLLRLFRLGTTKVYLPNSLRESQPTGPLKELEGTDIMPKVRLGVAQPQPCPLPPSRSNDKALTPRPSRLQILGLGFETLTAKVDSCDAVFTLAGEVVVSTGGSFVSNPDSPALDGVRSPDSGSAWQHSPVRPGRAEARSQAPLPTLRPPRPFARSPSLRRAYPLTPRPLPAAAFRGDDPAVPPDRRLLRLQPLAARDAAEAPARLRLHVPLLPARDAAARRRQRLL